MREHDNAAVIRAEATHPVSGGTHTVFAWLERIILTLGVLFFLFTLFFGICRVGDDAMGDAFPEGMTLFICHTDSRPDTGDVVAYQSAGTSGALLSRVIATEGQIVDYHPEKGLTVDGVPVARPDGTVLGNYSLPCTVPQNSVFVLGDNSAYALDKSCPSCGIVDNRLLMGKVLLCFSPLGSAGN